MLLARLLPLTPALILGLAVASRALAQEVIVDDADPVGVIRTGQWIVNTTEPGIYAGRQLLDIASLADLPTRQASSITFRAFLPKAGPYRVYVRYGANAKAWTGEPAPKPADLPASNVSVTVSYNGGAKVVRVNQRGEASDYIFHGNKLTQHSNGGDWVLLGTFPFKAGYFASVSLTNSQADGIVRADAVRFVYAAPPAVLPRTDAEVAAGLAAWRKPDGNGITCAECHGPAGYDIAVFGFNLADLRRATAPHLSQADADAIYAMIDRLRALYPPAGGMKDIEAFSPLQPGGTLIGSLAESTSQRDAAFGLYLKSRLLLGKRRITTLDDARQLGQEIAALDVPNTPVGLRFPAWSHSISREGTTFGSRFDEWLPSSGLQPVDGFEAQWFALQDAYIANPSDDNFWALYYAVARTPYLLEHDAHNATADTDQRWLHVSRLQFLNNLVFQHDQLQRALGRPALLSAETGVKPLPSQASLAHPSLLSIFWDLGDVARASPTATTSLTLRNQETMNHVPAWKQSVGLQLPWLWMGWTFDNALSHSGGGSSRTGEYLIGMLWNGSDEDASFRETYRFHSIYMNAVHQFKKGLAPAFWNADVERLPEQYITISKGYYLALGRPMLAYNDRDTPGYPGSAKLYRLMISNQVRASTLLYLDQAKRTGYAYETYEGGGLAALKEQGADVRKTLAWADPAWTAQDTAMMDEYDRVITTLPLR